MTWAPRIRRGLASGLVPALVVACAPEADTASVPGNGIVPAVAPATSINAVMVGLVDHAAHHVWELGRDGMAPVTDHDWMEVDHAAIMLMASGTWITAGGTGALDENWVRQPQWQAYAADVSEAGMLAWLASQRRDLDGVLRAGDELIEACEGCHQEYKPALPTEGIVHPHE